jgi:hypothetical protein
MAYELEISIIDAGDETIKVVHTFYGLTEAEVMTYKREHLASCEYFRSAEREHRTIEELTEIDDDELPQVEVDEDSEIA